MADWIGGRPFWEEMPRAFVLMTDPAVLLGLGLGVAPDALGDGLAVPARGRRPPVTAAPLLDADGLPEPADVDGLGATVAVTEALADGDAVVLPEADGEGALLPDAEGEAVGVGAGTP